MIFIFINIFNLYNIINKYIWKKNQRKVNNLMIINNSKCNIKILIYNTYKYNYLI